MAIPYRNPVHPGYLADPFVLRLADGSYVAYGTGEVVDGRVFAVLRSADLVTWQPVGGALEPLAAGHGSDYWAPEVAPQGGRFWLYYSVGRGDAGHHLRVASSEEPTGPFLDEGVDLSPDERFAIDPSPFRDVDGRWYLFHARDVLEGDRVGTMLAVTPLDGMTRTAGAARTILTPSSDWQVYLRDREMYGEVYDWHTLEGPFVCRRDGRYYCFYSGGSWQLASYAVAYAVADHPLGPWLEPVGAEPLLRTVPDRVIGPGHNCVVGSPYGDVIVYHAWDPAQTARRMCIDPVVWTDDGPQVLGASFEPTTLPRQA